MKFVIPTAPMLMTVPAMIWSTLWRMPSHASSRPSSAARDHRRGDADERAMQGVAR